MKDQSVKRSQKKNPCKHHRIYYCMQTGGSKCRDCKALL